MRSFLVCLVTLALVGVAFGIVCHPQTCDLHKCGELSEQECISRGEVGQFKVDPKGGFCACCPACIRILNEGENCSMLRFRGVPRTAVCDDGLWCNLKTLVCEKVI